MSPCRVCKAIDLFSGCIHVGFCSAILSWYCIEVSPQLIDLLWIFGGRDVSVLILSVYKLVYLVVCLWTFSISTSLTSADY